MEADTVDAKTDVLVIGAGIYGCATAFFLARFGVDVVVVDAGDIGAGASGANAGNLHLQLSPFSHATKSPEWIAEFARTLPFFVAALALWKQLGGFDAVDANHDGVVSEPELEAAIARATAEPASAVTANLVLGALDADHDHVVSRAEGDRLAR